MRRIILSTLKDWKTAENHKVILLRGARQVGKTYIVRELAKDFNYFLEVNFEKNPDIKQFFHQNLDPIRICTYLSAYFGIPVVDGKTLLFFDEIQSCPKAIQSLRFFYETRPGLHVISAGSLLEFAMEDITSWGVGRIRSIYMYPLSFDEFLMANNEDALIELKKNASPVSPLNPAFHEKLKDYLKRFLIIGGMPEVVQNYILTGDLLKCQNILDQLLTTFIDDFAKYKKRAPVARLEEVFRSITFQAGQKFKYSKVDPVVSSAVLKDALELLIKAGLAYKIHHSSAQGIPLGATGSSESNCAPLCEPSAAIAAQ